MKITTTTKVNTMTDFNKTTVLVETIDQTTGEVFVKIGTAMPFGEDEFSEIRGERIAFDKAYIHNLCRDMASHKATLNNLFKSIEEEKAILATLRHQLDKVEKDLSIYSDPELYDDDDDDDDDFDDSETFFDEDEDEDEEEDEEENE